MRAGLRLRTHIPPYGFIPMNRFFARAWLFLVSALVLLWVFFALYEAIGWLGLAAIFGFAGVIWLTCWALDEVVL
jgi:hypothetical protein